MSGMGVSNASGSRGVAWVQSKKLACAMHLTQL